MSALSEENFIFGSSKLTSTVSLYGLKSSLYRLINKNGKRNAEFNTWKIVTWRFKKSLCFKR